MNLSRVLPMNSGQLNSEKFVSSEGFAKLSVCSCLSAVSGPISNLPAFTSPQEWGKWLEHVNDFFGQFRPRALVPAVAPLCSSVSGDPRPYLDVYIHGTPATCLLDSGATVTVVGELGLRILDCAHVEYDVKPNGTSVVTADGVSQEVQGELQLPFTFKGVTKVIPCLVVPSVKQNFILGMNFGDAFGICLDFTNRTFSHNNEVRICTIKCIRSRDSLLPDEQRRLQCVVNKFSELVSSKLGRVKGVEHFIDTGDARPFKQRQYLLSPAMEKHLHGEVDEMLRLGVIQPSKSPWSSPILLVNKKNGEKRACFDGRKLNSVTLRDSYPLPRIDAILNRLRDSSYLSSLDLTKAFWQIPLEESSRPKTAFTVPGRGLFEFKVMPFGLSNSPQTLQRTMDALFGPDLLNNEVFVYLDDIVIASPDFDSHIQTLTSVYERLKEAGFKINLEKCQFCRPSLSFLGFIVDHQGLRTDPNKVDCIVNYPVPNTTTEIKRLIGLISYYRRFLKNFSTIASPITSLLHGKKKGQAIGWTPEADVALKEIKLLISSAPVLVSPDFSKRFFIQTDASDVGLGAVLFQEQDGLEHPIAFASRTLTSTERKYAATERELLGVIFGVEHFRGYVEGTDFTVITDCASLTWLHNLREPTGRLARWCMRLAQFSFDVKHRPGAKNVVPDALSRISLLESHQTIPDQWYSDMIGKVREFPDKYPDFKVKNDVLFKHMPSPLPFVSNLPEWKMVVPTANRDSIMRQFHDDPSAAHLGIRKTMARISDFYYWPKLRQSVSRFIFNCKICAAQKSNHLGRAGLMGSEKEVNFPFECVSLDILGPLPTSRNGYQYVVVVTDWFTKFVLLQPLRKASAKLIIKFLREQVFSIFGVPRILMADNGSQFIAREFKDYLTGLGIKNVWYNARYHPQVNPTERVNRVLVTALSSYLKENHRSWDENLFEIASALRSAPHDATQVSPNFLVFGRHVPCSANFYATDPITENSVLQIKSRMFWAKELAHLPEFYESVKKRLHQAYETNAKSYNLRKRPATFTVGDIVWKRNYLLSDAGVYFSKKLAPKYIACRVTKASPSGLTYHLEDLTGKDLGVWHLKDLKANTCDFEENVPKD